MNVALRQPMTLPQFLVWEARQETRYEFDGQQAVAMTGGTGAHEIIGGTLRALLRERLLGTPCRAWGPTIKIEVQGRIRYPDAFVSCTSFRRDASIVPDPVVVFEVLSAITSRTDRIEKLREYQATASIRRYVILEQEGIAATAYHRRGSDWTVQALMAGETLDLSEIGIALPLSDIYVDIDFLGPASSEA